MSFLQHIPAAYLDILYTHRITYNTKSCKHNYHQQFITMNIPTFVLMCAAIFSQHAKVQMHLENLHVCVDECALSCEKRGNESDSCFIYGHAFRIHNQQANMQLPDKRWPYCNKGMFQTYCEENQREPSEMRRECKFLL